MMEIYNLLKLALFLLLIYFIISRIVKYRSVRKLTGHTPVDLCLFSPFSLFSILAPRCGHFWNAGMSYTWVYRHSLYINRRFKAFYKISIMDQGVILYCSNLAAYNQVMAVNSDWDKPKDEMLKFLGDNVVTTVGDAWKRHRRITAPAFNNTTYQAVWQTTVGVYKDVVDTEWNSSQIIEVKDLNEITHKLALFIVAICGFGIPMVWTSSMRDENGKLSLTQMFLEIASTIPLRSLTPQFLFNLPIPKLKLVDEAYTQFAEFMHASIANREAEMNEKMATDNDMSDSIRDIFGRLVNAKITEGKLKITPEDVIGNCFIFVFAGHETTATAMCATTAFLALYPDVQENVYQEVRRILGDREPTYNDYDALEVVLNCFLETVRLFPPAWVSVREAQKDTTLALPRRDDPSIIEHLRVRKGDCVYLDLIGTNYDPDIYPDPDRWDPERWRSNSNNINASTNSSSSSSNATPPIISFLSGPRTCLGKKFASVEAVAFLTHLILDWKINPVLESNESLESWRKRYLNPKIFVTLSFGRVPLVLERRSR